jgi:hypothetical protein
MGYLGQVPRVVYRGVDNHLHELAIYPATGSWGDFDMTGVPGAVEPAGDPKGYFAQTPRVVFRASTRPVFEMEIEGGSWRRLEL